MFCTFDTPSISYRVSIISDISFNSMVPECSRVYSNEYVNRFRVAIDFECLS